MLPIRVDFWEAGRVLVEPDSELALMDIDAGREAFGLTFKGFFRKHPRLGLRCARASLRCAAASFLAV